MARKKRRKSRGTLYTALAGAVVVVVVIALGLTHHGPDARATADSGDKRGGSLVYLDYEKWYAFQEQISYWQNGGVWNNIGDRLVDINPKTYQLEPWIAQSWTVSGDGLTYTFVIRPGVTYSDGTPLDAQSVRKNLLWWDNGDPGKGVPRNPLYPQGMIVTADNATRSVVVKFQQPYIPFLNVLAAPKSSLLGDKTIDSSLDAQGIVTNIVASGPFVPVKYKPDEEIVLQRRKGYHWAPASSQNQGEAYLDSITIRPVHEISVRVGALQAGQADVVHYVEPSDEGPLARQGYNVVPSIYEGMSNQWSFRLKAPYVDDVRVRKAVEHAIDRNQIVEKLYTRNWTAASSVLTPQTPGYVDLSSQIAYDPAQSNELLDQAGWTGRDADGYRTKNGKTLEIKTYVDVYDADAGPHYQLIQRQLQKVGIKLTLLQTDYATYPTIYAKDQSIAIKRNGWQSTDANVLNSTYAAGIGDGFSLGGKDEKLEALLTASTTATSQDDRNKALAELQRYIVVDQAYAVPIVNDTQVFVTRPDIHGFTGGSQSLPWFYNTWTGKK